MRLDTVMTGHAIRAKRQEVFGRKHLIDLQMAIAASVLVKWRGVTFYVTIFAEECGVIRLGFMSR